MLVFETSAARNDAVVHYVIVWKVSDALDISVSFTLTGMLLARNIRHFDEEGCIKPADGDTTKRDLWTNNVDSLLWRLPQAP